MQQLTFSTPIFLKEACRSLKLWMNSCSSLAPNLTFFRGTEFGKSMSINWQYAAPGHMKGHTEKNMSKKHRCVVIMVVITSSQGGKCLLKNTEFMKKEKAHHVPVKRRQQRKTKIDLIFNPAESFYLSDSTDNRLFYLTSDGNLGPYFTHKHFHVSQLKPKSSAVNSKLKPILEEFIWKTSCIHFYKQFFTDKVFIKEKTILVG